MAETEGEFTQPDGQPPSSAGFIRSIPFLFYFFIYFTSFSHSISWRVRQFSLDSRESEFSPDCCTCPFAKFPGLLRYTEKTNLEGFNWKPLKDTRISAKRIAFEDCPKGNDGV
jgi:hypothetical protein